MSTFRRYGGLNYSSTNNITRSFISNSDQMNINNFSGLENTKETFKSHIDLSGNSILHTQSIYFQDGTNMSTAGNIGTQGPAGAQGSTGAGTQGAAGPQGLKGDTGVQGATGSQGNTGPKGDTGTQGATGVQGATGSQGNTGPKGDTGVQGATGPGSSLDITGVGGTDVYITGTPPITPVNILYTSLYISFNVAGQLTSASFNATSDYRIKENINLLQLDKYNTDNLKPVIYNHKETKQTNIGFLAHEVQEYFPFLVSGVKDGEKTQSINYTGLIGVLTKEIQELKKRVSKLELESV